MNVGEAALEPARELLALALDTDDLATALGLARRLRPWFAVAKVGLELFSAAGPASLGALADDGFAVFADLKLHDIPTTVRRAAEVVGALGATHLTVHTAGGDAMLAAAVEGFSASRNEDDTVSGARPRGILGVTVLTSEPVVDRDALERRARLGADARCVGLVCAADDLEAVGRAAPGLLRVVPGIRPAGVAHHDQARVATPADAVRAGAGLLVVGRAVTAAANPESAASALVADLAARGLVPATGPFR